MVRGAFPGSPFAAMELRQFSAPAGVGTIMQEYLTLTDVLAWPSLAGGTNRTTSKQSPL